MGSEMCIRDRRVSAADSVPQYELRARHVGPGDRKYEVWQVPAPATLQVRSSIRIAGLWGRNLDLVEHRVQKRLAKVGISLEMGPDTRQGTVRLTEQAALMLGLLFRSLAPMRNRVHMREVADGIEVMGQEEAAYWLGMAMHRKNPRRVLMALRFLLNTSRR